MSTAEAQPTLRLAYSINETCDLVNISRATCYRLMGSGVLEFVEVGHRRRILAESIDRMLQTDASADRVVSDE